MKRSSQAESATASGFSSTRNSLADSRAATLLATAKPELYPMGRTRNRASGKVSRSTEPSDEALSTITASKSAKVWAASASTQGCRKAPLS